MKTGHLDNFIAIVECGTVSEASRNLHIAQPALSTQLKAMEKKLGAPLFKRTKNRMELTAAGRIFYEKAKAIKVLENAAYNEINECVKGSRGILRIGLTHSHPDELITKIFSNFHRTFPNASYELFELHAEEMLALIRDGIIEIGIVRLPGTVPSYLETWFTIHEQLTATYLPETQWLPPDTDVISIQMLENVPLSTTKGFVGRITSLCENVGFSPNLLSICSSRALASMWAHEGAAVAILSDESDAIYPGLTTKPLLGTGAQSTRAVVTKKGEQLSSIGESFLTYCQNWLPPAGGNPEFSRRSK